MSPSPILKVLSTFRKRRIRALLMGGQACILYGGAEFSRDIDFAVAVDARNLDRLRRALADLRARPLFFPLLSAAVLRRGHACHFRCLAPGLRKLRVDVMGRMRGAAAFPALWKRRTRLPLPGGGHADVVSLKDLVRIKKTQRDKDWLMIRGLLEADIARGLRAGNLANLPFWLLEARTTSTLLELVRRYPRDTRRLAVRRPALRAALRGDAGRCDALLGKEEAAERRLDRRYWAPLRAELENWRMGRPR